MANTTNNSNEKDNNGSVPTSFNNGPGRERFYNTIKFDSSGDLQRATEIDERMIREKYDEDSELVDLEREILTGDEDENRRRKMEGAKSMSMKGRGHMPSKLGSTAGKMVARTGQRGAQVKEMMESDNENKNHKKEKDMEIKKESSVGKGGSNEAAATTAATGATATKKQDSGSNDGSNKLSESNESKLLRSQRQRGVKNSSGSGGSGDGSDDNNTKNKIKNKTSGDEKMMIIKENGTNENAAEMNENDLLCDFGDEKQPMVVASPRKKCKSIFSSNLNESGDADARGKNNNKPNDGYRQGGRNYLQKQGDKNVKLIKSKDNNHSNDNSNGSGKQGGRQHRNVMRAPKRNDSSSDDMIIPDEEETKNANLLSECDNLFVPPVAPLFKPPNHAVAGNEAMHKLASVNIDVNDGTNVKAMNITTIDDSLYDQQFQIEPELLSARPGSDDSFRLFDPSVMQGKSNEGSDEGEQPASGRGRRRRSSGRNTSNKSDSTRKTSGSDNSSYKEGNGSPEKEDNITEESDSDVDISNNDLSDEDVYEADYDDKERLIEHLEDDLGENTNNHRDGRPLITGNMNNGSLAGQAIPGLLLNGRRAQRGRPPRNQTVAPSRGISRKKKNSNTTKGESNAKNSKDNKSSSSLATLTTMLPNKTNRGDRNGKTKTVAKMFDDRGEFTVAKVDIESSKNRGKQVSGSKSNATNNKMIGKRNLSSAMAKSGSDNAPSKRGKKNGDSDTKSLSSSGKSEGLQTSVLGNAVAAASKPAGTTVARGREPNAQGGPRRSKHHNPWGLDEAQALIEGVSRCGGGKWADIKKLGFPEIEHRTAVDLKDKWRNLLRIATLPTPSGRETTSKSGGDKKREIPRAMLDRVRELAMQHAKNKERELAAKAAQAQAQQRG